MDGRFEARVLEPSPPAVARPPWFADDPAASGKRRNGQQVLGPTSAADITWDELCRGEPELAPWAADRWLGAWRALEKPPASFAQTRNALQSLAEHVLATARHCSNGKIGLRYTLRGFGTPFFGEDEQVRIEGAELVHQIRGEERRCPITTAGDAASAIGIPCGAPDVYRPSTPLEPAARLEIDPESTGYLGDLYGFATSALEELRARATPDEKVSRVQLWPEHFDVALEMGDESCGARAGYGISPGDADHEQPYLYVVPWGECPNDPWWNATYFGGASFDVSELLGSPDQRSRALGFFDEGRRRLREESVRAGASS